MSALLDRILGRGTGRAPKAKLTSDVLAAEIAEREKLRTEAQARIDRHPVERQAALDTLDKDRLKRADDDVADAQRDVELLTHALKELEVELPRQLAAEARSALSERARQIRKRVADRGVKVMDRYDELAAELAVVLDEWQSIFNEIVATNDQLRRAGLPEPEVQLPKAIWRQEPDQIVPEVREWVEEFQTYNDRTGQWQRSGVLQMTPDGVRPVEQGYRKEKVEVVTRAASTRRGRSIGGFVVSLPASRLDGPQHWPRPQPTA